MNTQIIPQAPFVQQALEQFKEQFPHFSSKPSNVARIHKAADAVLAGRVRSTNDPHTFVVTSNSDSNGCYLVNTQAHSCECLWSTHGKCCTHRIEVRLALTALELQKQFDYEQAQQRQREALAEMLKSENSTWDYVDSQIVHVCDDGFTGANIFGVGSNLWCARCNHNMPEHLMTRESRIAYNYNCSIDEDTEVSE